MPVTTAPEGPTGTVSGRRRPNRRLVLILSVAAVVVLVAVAAAAVYTERPVFCPVCHEMTPYYDAWASGPHANTSCVDCHVDAGVVNHALHKFVALREVWDHFTRDNRFPTWGVELPNARCISCHPTVRTFGASKFDHQLHANKASCKDCHATAGHAVSSAALEAAGVLNTAASGPPLPGDVTASSAPGHIKVSCQECHDQAKMRCSQCHTAPHEPRGECSGCHQPGQKFTFIHTAATACEQCHQPPANHFAGACSVCHKVSIPFKETVFTHPGNTGEHSYRSFACVKCHPTSYSVASCTCHGGRPPRGD